MVPWRCKCRRFFLVASFLAVASMLGKPEALVPAGREPAMEVVFVHGFGGPNEDEKRFVQLLREEMEKVGARVHAPTYHPGGRVGATSLPRFMEELKALAESSETNVTLLGFSVGGWLVASFQERWPHLVKRVVLLAPAIDNFERNFEGKAEQDWYMPAAYVAELREMTARPAIKVPAMLVHGDCETDAGGSALWRVKEWAQAENFARCYFPEGLGHSMDIVEAGPGFGAVKSWLMGAEDLLT
ncbi:unnamed protein product [Cladocopium goreaui]|uniref:AB hydrolase-1 domain-containing protein n=1 Tax=Cladocopium goreaui TaxID=2562237 RepID=A0A9P1CDW8_9DINO|nr:unnamed protein product [Cladocopium goreaui]